MPKSEFYPGFYEPEGIKPLSGPDTIKYVQEELGQSKVLLSFSCGKDSVALWLSLREHFEIIPFYLYRIPGISFVEDSLAYYEDYFGQEIVRLPHPTFYRMLANCVWQPPQRVGWIEAMSLYEVSYDDLNWLLGAKFGIDEPMCCTGIRAVDNVRRRVNIMRSGPINLKRRYFYPIWDVNMATLLGMLGKAKIKLAIDYRLFGRSFDGMDYGLGRPEIITNAVQAHRNENDTVAQFLDDCCIVGAEHYAVGAQLSAAYRDWCNENSVTPLGGRRLGEALRRKGFEYKAKLVAGKTKKCWSGLGLEI